MAFCTHFFYFRITPTYLSLSNPGHMDCNAFDKSIEECVAVICRDECWALSRFRDFCWFPWNTWMSTRWWSLWKDVAMVSEMPPLQVRNCRHNLSIVQEKIDKLPCTGTGHVILCNWRCELYYQILWGCTVWSYICIVFSIKCTNYLIHDYYYIANL